MKKKIINLIFIAVCITLMLCTGISIVLTNDNLTFAYSAGGVTDSTEAPSGGQDSFTTGYLAAIKEFFAKNWLYVLIGVVALILVIVIIAVSVSSKKKAKKKKLLLEEKRKLIESLKQGSLEKPAENTESVNKTFENALNTEKNAQGMQIPNSVDSSTAVAQNSQLQELMRQYQQEVDGTEEILDSIDENDDIEKQIAEEIELIERLESEYELSSKLIEELSNKAKKQEARTIDAEEEVRPFSRDEMQIPSKRIRYVEPSSVREYQEPVVVERIVEKVVEKEPDTSKFITKDWLLEMLNIKNASNYSNNAELEKLEREKQELQKELESARLELQKQLEQERENLKRQLEEARAKEEAEKISVANAIVEDDKEQALKEERDRLEKEKLELVKQLEEMQAQVNSVANAEEEPVQEEKVEPEEIEPEEEDGNLKKVPNNAVVINSVNKMNLQEAYWKLPSKQRSYFNKLRDYADVKPNARAKETRTHVAVGVGNKNYIRLGIKKGIVIAYFVSESDDMQRLRLTGEVPLKPEETQIKIVNDEALELAKRMIDLRVEQVEKETQIIKEIRKQKRKEARKK